MGRWPFGQRGGLTEAPFSSNDPEVCAHQALRLQDMLREAAGRYAQAWMILDRLEIVYLCAGRREDADRAYQDKCALVRPASPEEGRGLFGRLKWWWQTNREEKQYRQGQRAVHRNLAALHRAAPWNTSAR
ncbi:hypothetical protein [Paenarthrobacter sp. YJN-5]|uniref:hypothetical protein n=1 Tax=Paenarthrobacter sp. YJN-5 TaxID=2735316 RepID=UPI0018780B37|nr:hypothetical protein [Paenarthrobacter sp. YJN-5]QOT19591.1 hypothetical protein HMI59_23500 [Paenarthrobacter sp. YJN-5]